MRTVALTPQRVDLVDEDGIFSDWGKAILYSHNPEMGDLIGVIAAQDGKLRWLESHKVRWDIE